MPAVMAAITEAMAVDGILGSPDRQAEKLREAEAACKCAESWVGYGISGESVSRQIPSYTLTFSAISSSSSPHCIACCPFQQLPPP